MAYYKSIVPFFTLYRCDLVPVFAFGQNNLFPLVGGGYNSRFSRFQRWLYSKTRAGCFCCWGLSWCLPKRSPIFVVGKDSLLIYFIAAWRSNCQSLRMHVFLKREVARPGFSLTTSTLCEKRLKQSMKSNCTSSRVDLIVAVFLPVYSPLGSTGPVEELKGSHEGEKRVTIFRFSWMVLLTGLS